MILLCDSLPFSVTATNTDTRTKAKHLISDKMNTVWQAAATTAVITLDLNALKTIDTIALLGLDISGATVSIEAFNGATSLFVKSITSEKAEGRSGIALYRHSNVVDATRVVVTVTASSVFQIARVIVGKSLTGKGVESDAGFGFEDMSDKYEASGYEAFNELPRYPVWDVSIPLIRDDEVRAVWQPFNARVGISRPFLMIPLFDQPERTKSDWIYGRYQSQPLLKSRACVDGWVNAFKVRGVIT